MDKRLMETFKTQTAKCLQMEIRRIHSGLPDEV